MESHVEKLLNKISIVCATTSTLILLLLYLQTPKTCIPPNTPFTKPHLHFPSSTCHPSLRRPFLSPSSKTRRLWNSSSWVARVDSLSSFFLRLHLLRNHSRVICVSAGAGHEVMALQNIGVADVTAVELVDSLPLVRRADPHNLPFFDGVFDIGFTMRLREALYPLRLAGEMERTVRKGGICVVVVEECGMQQLLEVVRLFRSSTFVAAHNVTLLGLKMTTILLRPTLSSSSSSSPPLINHVLVHH